MEKKSKENIQIRLCVRFIMDDIVETKSSSYFGHLDHIRKLCQTGNGDHILVSFQLGPGKVIKQSVFEHFHQMSKR